MFLYVYAYSHFFYSVNHCLTGDAAVDGQSCSAVRFVDVAEPRKMPDGQQDSEDRFVYFRLPLDGFSVIFWGTSNNPIYNIQVWIKSYKIRHFTCQALTTQRSSKSTSISLSRSLFTYPMDDPSSLCQSRSECTWGRHDLWTLKLKKEYSRLAWGSVRLDPVRSMAASHLWYADHGYGFQYCDMYVFKPLWPVTLYPEEGSRKVSRNP